MTPEEIRQAAIEYAKNNKLRIARELTDPAQFEPDERPVSVFMAGSPGAGKTEYSKVLVEIFEKNKKRHVVRIDGDALRSLFPDYSGNNSHLFQGAVSLVVEKMHDLVLHNKQNFVLDGTLSTFEKAADNIHRSLGKGRHVFIFYIYQKPETAWRFTQARETAEGRNIPKEAFIEQYLGAKATVAKLKAEFGDKIDVFLVKKDFEFNTVEDIVEISLPAQIDDVIQEEYSKKELFERL